MSRKIEIKECTTVELLQGCVDLQRRVFELPEVEISPVRHFIVTMHAGGFTLGAFYEEKLIGFSLSVPAVLNGERALYSHMTAVEGDFQGEGIGARLKWKQRERSLKDGIKLIKWTFQPEKARNAFFNLEKLGAEVRDYMPNFYGTDYGAPTGADSSIAIRSDRLFALWSLESEKVKTLESGEKYIESRKPVGFIEVPADWGQLLAEDRTAAAVEQERLRTEFMDQFANGRVCGGFQKNPDSYKYLFF